MTTDWKESYRILWQAFGFQPPLEKEIICHLVGKKLIDLVALDAEFTKRHEGYFISNLSIMQFIERKYGNEVVEHLNNLLP